MYPKSIGFTDMAAVTIDMNALAIASPLLMILMLEMLFKIQGFLSQAVCSIEFDRSLIGRHDGDRDFGTRQRVQA